MKTLFRNDDDHYLKIHSTQHEIITKYRRFYYDTARDISRISNEKFESCKIPYAYALFKNKDINKLRPIVSYSPHPLKRILNITCRALNHMIKKIDNNHAIHCNMETCIELKDRIKEFEKRMKYKFGKRTRFAYIMGDVKNMYTELPHHTIIKAVKWILQAYKHQTRRDTLTVKRRGKGGVSNGRAINTFSSTSITLTQILEVVKFDLENAIFAVGSPERTHNTFRQTIGVPMGSPLSPALAKITCMFYENKLMQQLKHENICYLEGLRFMDDLLALGVFDHTSPTSRQAITDRMNKLTKCYDTRMRLELESESGVDERKNKKETTYLQSNLIFQKNSIEMYENNKNAEQMKKLGTQKLLRFPHILSYAPIRQKIAICYQGAIAIERYSTTAKLKLKQFRRLTRELLGPLQYPKKFILKTLLYMTKHYNTQHKHWSFIFEKYMEKSIRKRTASHR